MAVWFFGLVHEIGHFAAAAAEVPAAGPLSDDGIRAGLEIGIDQMAVDPRDLTALREFARTQPLNHVRAEAHADLFAAGVLFQSTVDILAETKAQFQIDQFMAELVIAVNLVALFERCKQTVRLSTRGGSSADILRLQFSTPAFFVRASMVREYLRQAAATWLADGPPGDTRLEAVDRLLDQVSQQLAERFNAVETGLARAMRFMLFPRERQPDVLDRLAAEVHAGDAGMLQVQLQHFLQITAERGAHSANLEVLQALVDEHGRAGESRPVQDAAHPFAYFVPWVKATQGDVEWPFSLETRFGRVVLVFVSDGELYDAFFKASAAGLAPGYALQTTLVAASDSQHLVSKLLDSMPDDNRNISVAIQGTPLFDRYVRELSNDTIWT